VIFAIFTKCDVFLPFLTFLLPHCGPCDNFVI